MSVTHLVDAGCFDISSCVLIDEYELAVLVYVLVHFVLVVPAASVVVVQTFKKSGFAPVGFCAVYPVVPFLVAAFPVVVVE